MPRTSRQKKENVKRNHTSFRQNDTGKLMLKYLAKEKKMTTTEYLDGRILKDFINSKGY